ncbi:MAG: ATP-dependent helicase HrpB [Myxococcota bacterium]
MPLPIDPLLPELVETFRKQPALVLEAPPGAGKTTRVPRAMLDAGLLEKGEVLVLQPRRLAARLAARRVAAELGEELGQQVGYTVRFEDVSSPRTRIRFITEGVLTRRLISDPTLKGVAAVLLDEFHERHLAGDVGLALLKRLQQLHRPELLVGVMSATLDTGPIAQFLSSCATLRSEGRRFEVRIEYALPDERPLASRVAHALTRACEEGLTGDVLVFLPGAAEIRQSMESCAGLAQRFGLLLLPLHGELSVEEQDRAIKKAPQKKVIFSTNVAETSVTIDGVVVVIDSGLARVASQSPWTGLPTLSVQPISQASATQRAGRAGRTQPGRCFRLYTSHDFYTRPTHDAPEIKRLDLAELVLELKAAGVQQLSQFTFFEAPHPMALEQAELLLRRLGALSPEGGLTTLGRRMLAFPVHPRQARLLWEAEARGVALEGAWLAALAGVEVLVEQRARGLREPGRGQNKLDIMGPSDLLARMDLLQEVLKGGFQPERVRQHGLDVGAVATVERAQKQLLRLLDKRVSRPPTPKLLEEATLMAVVAAYPDRIARRRVLPPKPGEHHRPLSRELIFTFGGTATLAESSIVLEADPLVALDAEARSEGKNSSVRVRLASKVELSWLKELFPGTLERRSELRFNELSESVEKLEGLYYGNLLIESRKLPLDPAEAEGVLWQAAKEKGPEAFCPEGELLQWQQRLAFLARMRPELGIEPPPAAEVLELLELLCSGLTSFEELRRAGLLKEVQGLLSAEKRQQVTTLAPEKVKLPGGRWVRVEYPAGQTPCVASRLQDFFGMRQGPSILGGKLPLVLHLLAPNQRAVQVTTDLASFWGQHYPALRKELGRKYPRHAWPEDPLTAEPAAPNERRR